MNTWQKIKANPSLLSHYLVREKVMDAIRQFFKAQGFHEVFTPILVPIPSIEPNLEVFSTQLTTSKGISRPGYLIMSPEYSLKKLLSAGIGNVFEITRAFRNQEEVSATHNPEFSILEWYRINADYTHVMRDFEQLFCSIIQTVSPQTDLTAFSYQGDVYDLTTPWPRWSVPEAFRNCCQIDIDTLLDEKKLLEVAAWKGYSISAETTWEQVFYQLIFNEIEPEMKRLRKPVFLYDYPVSQAALSKRKASDPRLAERFEVFLAGMELGNCFSELTDATEQKSRFLDDYASRQKTGKTLYPIDEDLILALSDGMPQVSGIAVGVDRLVMLAQNAPTISETLFFPAHELFDLE